MIHERKHTQWLRLGLLVAILMAIALLPSASTVTQAQGGGMISYGAKVFATIAADAPRVTYSFEGSAGDVVTAIADNWTGTLDLRAELIAPNGLSIASSAQNTLDDNMQGAHLSAVLPGDGIYLLWITSENETTGDFALTLLGRSAPDSTELIFGQAVDVTLIPAADPLLFWFEAEDCPTSLVVTNLSEGQPFTYPFALKVYDQRGQTVALLRGGEELEDWVTVTPRSGRYEVEVSSDHLLEAGNFRLLVTCSADVPGCLPGQAGLSGVVGTGPQECPRCFVPGDPPESGGCPDLNFRAEAFPLEGAYRVTVTWDTMAGATGYTVTVYGRTADSGEMYLTHANWTPGDPTSFTWFLPEHYVAFRFLLRVAIGDDVLCSAETGLEFEVPPDGGEPVCETFSIDMDITDLDTRQVTWTWTAYPGAEAYVVEWFELEDETEVLQGSILLGAGTTSFTTTLPPPSGASDTWRVRVRVQLDGGFPCSAEDTFGFLDRVPDCEDFILVETVHTATSSTIIWSEYPGALGYMMSVLDETGETMIPPFPLLLPPDQLSYVLEGLPPGTYLVRVGPWMEATFCEEELVLTFEQGQFPCLIRTNRVDVRVRVGPGLDRAAFAFLTAGVEYPVIGFAYDAAGNRWWQLDRTAIPGGEAALSLWVLDSEVEEIGNCDNVPQGDVPPIVPAEPEVPPGEPGRPPEGGWGPCGSCDTCGHPASECVTSPEGACLWDPATCGELPPPGAGCLRISAAIDMGQCYGGGSARIVTAPNCDGGFSPGTAITASASAEDAKCHVMSWSGCGVSGGGASISFTATSSCTVTAHMGYN